MTAHYRINLHVLTALVALAILPFSVTASSAAVPVLHCSDSSDCPKGRFCKIGPHKNTGICVSNPSKAKKKKKKSY
jgi:hypothetical protein